MQSIFQLGISKSNNFYFHRSSCTLTGLIIGVTLARHLNLDAFKNPRFKIVACPISPQFSWLHTRLNYFTAPWSRIIAISPRNGITQVCRWIKDRGGPDLESRVVDFLQREVDFITDLEVIGKYGAHSELSRAAAQNADNHMKIESSIPWICGITIPFILGHFSAKPFSVMMARLEDGAKDGENILFWQTKSAVQPRGCEEEFDKLKELVDGDEELEQGDC
jgi:hypothetical protein